MKDAIQEFTNRFLDLLPNLILSLVILVVALERKKQADATAKIASLEKVLG